MLSLAEIVEQTCPRSMTREAWRSKLNRILTYAEVRMALLGGDHPRYPEEAVERFRALAPYYAKGYKPEEIARRIREQVVEPAPEYPLNEYPVIEQTEYSVNEQPATPETGTDLVAMSRQAGELIVSLRDYVAIEVQRQALGAPPPPEDKLLRAAGAADLLGCGIANVHKQLGGYGVAPVAMRPRRWRRSDILKLIARL